MDIPRTRLIWTCLAFAALAGCEGGPRISDSSVELVTYDRLRTLRDEGVASVKVVDVRSPEEFAQGHIAGAINVPLPDVRAAHPVVGKAKTVVVYGADWRRPLSLAAAKRLVAEGRGNVLDFRGGFEQWRSRGGPVEPAGAGPTTKPAPEGFPELPPPTAP